MQLYKRLVSLVIVCVTTCSVLLWLLYAPHDKLLTSKTEDVKHDIIENLDAHPLNNVDVSARNQHHKERGSYPLRVENRKLLSQDLSAAVPHKPKENKPLNNRPSTSAGYIITQTYHGQMTRAIRNMILQQCWGGTLTTSSSVHIVEPFSAESNLYHTPAFWTSANTAPRFSDYHDLDFYNECSIHNRSIPLAMWDEFIMKAPRYAVAVMAPPKACNNLNTKGTNNNTRGIVSSTCSWSKPFRTFVGGLTKRGFTVERSVCISCNILNHPLTLQDLHNQIYQGRSVSETTVLMNSWRNYDVTSTWLKMPSYCKMAEDPISSKRLIPSKSVVENTQYYKRHILRSDKVVAVMFRIERFLTLKVSGRSDESVQSCINKALAIHDKIRITNNELSDSGTFLTLDIGRFGSGIMQNEEVVKRFGQDSLKSIRGTVSKAVHDLYNGKYTIKTWEDTFVEASGGIEERGYIAMLQRNIATEADCLILMGGGSFQQVAAFQYIKNHPDPSTRCLHTVCTVDDFAKLFK